MVQAMTDDGGSRPGAEDGRRIWMETCCSVLSGRSVNSVANSVACVWGVQARSKP